MNDITSRSARQSPQVHPADGTTRSISPIASVPQKRALEDDHQPSIPSPLNPEFPRQRDDAPAARDRAARAKKESFKKRESKGPTITESRATPDPKSPSKQRPSEQHLAPMRYKLATPKISDFNVPQGPTFVPHHTIDGPDGQKIEFQEATDQYGTPKLAIGRNECANCFLVYSTRRTFVIPTVSQIQHSPHPNIIASRRSSHMALT